MLSEKRKRVLEDLSHNPFMSITDLMHMHEWKRSPLYRQLRSMEKDGLVAHVNHSSDAPRPTHRYHLTRGGAVALAETLRLSPAEIMDRVGASGKGLATYHRLIDILVGVYNCAGTIAQCYDLPSLRIQLFSAGPLDAVLRLPDSPHSLGVMVHRRALSQSYFERKLKKYTSLDDARPSCLLVISSGFTTDHAVARIVALNYDGRAEIAPLDKLGVPCERVWHNPNSYDDDTRPWDTWDMLDRIPGRLTDEPVQDYEPRVQPFRKAALPRDGWKPVTVLTHGEREALYTIADWPLAKEEVIATLAEMGEDTLSRFVRTLRKHGLVEWIPVSEDDERMTLTNMGIVYVCRAARSDYQKEKNLWSVEGDEIIGGNLRMLQREIRHTDMVYEIVRRSKVGAAVVRARRIVITPAHKTERYFRPESERNTRSIRPDAHIYMEAKDGTRYVLLLEAERRGLSRQGMKKRLIHYEQYLRTKRSRYDDPVAPWIAVVLEDGGTEANFSVAQVDAGMTDLPTILTNMSELSRSPAGPFDPVWRIPGDYGLRQYLDELHK